MANRKPYVNVAGVDSELPDGDNIADPVLAALSQILGRDGATLLEVEAKYNAARFTLRPADAGPVYEQNYAIGHHAIGASSSFSATTTFVPSDLFFIAWFGTGFLVLRKLWVTLSTSAVVGTRAGQGNIYLRDVKPLLGAPSTNLWCMPPQATIGNNLNLGTPSVQNFHSLKQRQLPPQCIMALPTGASSPTGSMNWTGSISNANNSNHQFQFGVKSQVGIDLPPTMLVDASAGQSPLIYEPSQGAVIGISYPVAVTSQVVNFSVNAVWDEWVPILPVTL
jgi:hypothetical protein